MTRNANEAAGGAADISTNIDGVAQAADGTLSRAQESQQAAQELVSIATQLGSLMRQFKIERGDRRVAIALPVRINGTDIDGRAVDQEVMTINVSRKGALLVGINGKLKLGSQISLARLGKMESFRIVWVGAENTAKARQIGVSAIDSASSFWKDVAGTELEAESAGAEGDFAESAPAKLKARAHGA
jgi:hypothetical protein